MSLKDQSSKASPKRKQGAGTEGSILTRLIARHYLGKPELDRFLAIKYPTLGSMWAGARNELAFRLGRSHGHRLTTLNLETTNRCNLACVMCPVNNGMTREKRDLEFEAFRQIVDASPNLELILMFQWGEALLVADFFERVRYAADRGIRVMVTSNGTTLTREVCERILDCGLERITFSVDGRPETHEKIRGFPYEKFRANVERLVEMRDQAEHALQIDVNMTIWQENEAEASDVRTEWEQLVDRVQFIPRFRDEIRSKPCRELWRGAMVVLSDGRAVPCCRDFEGELALGQVADQSVEEIWNGEIMQDLRRRHLAKDFPPLCARCGEYDTSVVSPRFS
ncbi:MAG: radical SAM protein [Planctomycetota bacterium]